jgi:DNA-binding CsgD family transcriptional regulator
MPNKDTYPRIFCMLAPVSGNIFDTSGAMFAGGYSARNIILDKQLFLVEEDQELNSFFRYNGASGLSFMGFHLPVRLYPEGSVFLDREWAAVLLVPAEDIEYFVSGFHLRLAAMFIFLLILGVFISFILSRRYIKPISAGLDLIKSDNLAEAPKTKIPEIDDLIGHLTRKIEELEKTNQAGESTALLNEFLSKVHTLSPAERTVFNLYAQQYNAKEIAGILCLSINTIKTHTKRIYAKLMVSSREELLVYIDLLKEAGKEFN